MVKLIQINYSKVIINLDLIRLDRVPLSRNRVQVEKDFADGLLAAEVVRFYFPSVVDMKSLRTAKNLNERQMQWQ